MKNLVVASAIMALMSCLKPAKRNFKVNLGPKPRIDELFTNRIFEKRQGLFATIPQNLLDLVTSELLTEFKNISIEEETKKVKKEPLPAGRLEHSVGGLTIELCTSDLKLKFSEESPSEATLDFEFCSINLTVHDATGKIYLNALPDKPLVLSIQKLALKDKLKARRVQVKANIAFGFDGEVFINDMELLAGLNDLTDPANYDMDLTYSGFENGSGALGDEVNRWRKTLLDGILTGVQGYSVAALKNSITRATRKTLRKIDKGKFLRGDSGFKFDMGPFNVTGSLRPAGLVGGTEGLGLAAEVISSIDTSDEFLNCKPVHDKYMDPAVVDLRSYHNFFKFPERLNRFNLESLSDFRAGLYLSKEFVNYLLWQPFGSRGNCDFRIPLPNGIDGTLTMIYQAPIFIEFGSASEHVSDLEGIAVTIQMPELKLVLSKTFTDELAKHNIDISINADGRAELSTPGFPYTFFLLANDGNTAAVPHPFVKSIYSDRYANPAAPTVDNIASFISDTVPNYTLPEKYNEKAKALLQSLFDQILAYTTWQNLLKAKSDGSEFIVSGFEWDREAIIAKISGSVSQDVGFGLTGESANFSSRSIPTKSPFFTLADQPEGGIKADLSLPNVLKMGRDRVAELFSTASFLPKGWACTVQPVEKGFSSIGNSQVFLDYAVCGFEGSVRIEYRWHHQVVFGEDRQESKPVSYLRLRHLYPGNQDGDGTKVQHWLNLWKDPGEQLKSPHDTKLKWLNGTGLKYVRGICIGEKRCDAHPGEAHVAEVEIW